MKKGFDLGAFLSEARSEGRVDSEGSFTVAENKALDKLAQFSLPGEYDWVLKIVQAANAWNCEALTISQTRVATSFYFKPEVLPQESHLIQALRSGSSTADGAIHELCLALRALVDQVELSFVLAVHDGTGPAEPIFSGYDVSRLSGNERKTWVNLDREGLRLTVSHFRKKERLTGRYIPTVARVARRHLKILETLQERAFCSPMPILVDGIDTTNLLANESFGADEHYRPLAIGLPEAEEISWLAYPTRSDASLYSRPIETRKQTIWCYLFTVHYLSLPKLHKALSLGIEWSAFAPFRPPKNRFIWTRYGVAVSELVSRSSCVATSLMTFLNGDHLRADLSGLSVYLESQEKRKAERFKELVASELPKLIGEADYLAGARVMPPVQMNFGSDEIAKKGELQAGESALSADISGPFEQFNSFVDFLGSRWREFKATPHRKAYLNKWRQFILMEIRSLEKDLQLFRFQQGEEG